MLTQSNALDSLAQTRGHSRGVIASVARAVKKSFTSVSRDRFDETGSVVDEHVSHEEVRDLKEPDWNTTTGSVRVSIKSEDNIRHTLISLTISAA